MPNKSKQALKQSEYPLTRDDVDFVFSNIQSLSFVAGGLATGRIKREKDGKFSALCTPLFSFSQAPAELRLFLDPYDAYKAIIDFANRVQHEIDTLK